MPYMHKMHTFPDACIDLFPALMEVVSAIAKAKASQDDRLKPKALCFKTSDRFAKCVRNFHLNTKYAQYAKYIDI